MKNVKRPYKQVEVQPALDKDNLKQDMLILWALRTNNYHIKELANLSFNRLNTV